MELEKAIDMVPRKVICWAMCKLGADEWLISVVKSVHVDTRTLVRTVYGNNEVFGVLWLLYIMVVI